MSTRSTWIPSLDGRQGREQAEGAHVDDVRDDRVVAGVEGREERRVQRGHAGGEHCGGLTVVEAGEFVLQTELVGPGLAGVDEQVRVTVVQGGGILG